MQKEFEKQEKLKILDEEHKKQMLKDIEDREAKHKQHEPVSDLSLLFLICFVKYLVALFATTFLVAFASCKCVSLSYETQEQLNLYRPYGTASVTAIVLLFGHAAHHLYLQIIPL
jgi:hypothetical protein